MFIHAPSKNRPFHLGRFPLETLPTDADIAAREAARPPLTAPEPQGPQDGPLARAAAHYQDLFAKFADGPVAPKPAPVPDDLAQRTADIKGAATFLDSDQTGICAIPPSAWVSGGDHPAHEYAVVILVERPRVPEADNLASEWVQPARDAVADMRAAEIAVCVAGHIRTMGFAARAHIEGLSLLDAERLAVLAGLAVRQDDGSIVNPYLGRDFALAVVSTDYVLATDKPLHADALKPRRLSYWFGINGAQSGRERNRRAKRASHLSRYPMETVKRIPNARPR